MRRVNRSDETFERGQHKGETFLQVATRDPSYHLRYFDMNPDPPIQIQRYADWFGQCSPTRFIAEREHRADLAERAGFYFHEHLGDNDEEDENDGFLDQYYLPF